MGYRKPGRLVSPTFRGTRRKGRRPPIDIPTRVAPSATVHPGHSLAAAFARGRPARGYPGRFRTRKKGRCPMTALHILLAAPDSRAVAAHRAFLIRQGFDVSVCGDGLE